MDDLSRKSAIAAPEHLNNTGCEIRYSEGKGRGVFASQIIPAGTLLEVSPVLLFTKSEYAEHGRHTVLDHYTFKWRDGRMALALGLGSLFNHSERPNVSFTLDPQTESIRFVTSRKVECNEELFIFYGHSLWFTPVDRDGSQLATPAGIGATENEAHLTNGSEFLERAFQVEDDHDQIVPEADLPFTVLKLVDDTEEDTLEAIRTTEAWVVDIPDPKHLAMMLKWLKKQGLDTPDLAHLKRIRKREGVTTLLLSKLISLEDPAPLLPEEPSLPAPYNTTIPESAALTLLSQQLKSAIWPTIYTPSRKYEAEKWTSAKVKWVRQAMQIAIEAAKAAKSRGELPVAAHLPLPFDKVDEGLLPIAFTSNDTRTSTSHPLRHAAQNIARSVADYLASPPPQDFSAAPSSTSSSTPDTSADPNQNGRNYLLTSQTLFITHEPCIMCSMALLHSRVKDVFYLIPMNKTGGCGGVTCLPKLPGVNHRFGIKKWKDPWGEFEIDELRVGDDVDV